MRVLLRRILFVGTSHSINVVEEEGVNTFGIGNLTRQSMTSRLLVEDEAVGLEVDHGAAEAVEAVVIDNPQLWHLPPILAHVDHLPVGGRLVNWRTIGADPWMLKVIEKGCGIVFVAKPKLYISLGAFYAVSQQLHVNLLERLSSLLRESFCTQNLIMPLFCLCLNILADTS